MRTHNWRQTGRGRTALAVCLAATALALGGCESNGDPTAPADSTITVSATPQTLVVPVGGRNKAKIVATLFSKNGTRLPNQEITFSTTAGDLDPIAETPLKTDSNGQSTCTLDTSTAATVTARSGSISGTTQVQTVTGNISSIALSVTPQNINSCNDQLTLVATVLDNANTGVQGVLVIFKTPSSTLTGDYDPGNQIPSDIDGKALTIWTPDLVTCQQICKQSTRDPNAPACTLTIGAADTSGSFQAVDVPININIP